MKTKFSKSFTTWFFPVGDDIRQVVVDWVNYLRQEKLWGLDDPLFPGTKIVVARSGDATTSEDFLALSSVCPHLGCRVHWEGPQDRFFCPCHNGAFDRLGNPIAGPPKAANQPLMRFPLKVEAGLLYLEAPTVALTDRNDDRSSSPGEGVA